LQKSCLKKGISANKSNLPVYYNVIGKTPLKSAIYPMQGMATGNGNVFLQH